MARQERAIRTRNAVLTAAAAVFAERGYEAATIQEILERAAVTKGALYFHFPSKEDLARGVLDHAVTEPPPEQPLKLQSFVDMGLILAHRLPREPLLRGAARIAADQSNQRFFGKPWHDWVQLTSQQIVAAQGQGEVLPHVDPERTAQTMVGSFTGIQLMSQAATEMADFEERISLLYDLVLPSIAVPGVLGRLDTRPERGARAFAEARAAAGDHTPADPGQPETFGADRPAVRTA
ncbi:ScbR family autoregulator-binding transcription factor [Streptomyces sp. NBC_00102]|uniref:ScbR family autoregulator-binding transcription factor n=1 Tax=Streptomyces sp. NBC_00102 TaxID=2975652 RepID=UPI002252BEE3|nr:ScbR family autoregulator-binding transcription factor [Streptomyces sp. NBC_00102]MCX5399744.1 ScbR family autoregulator-binding transcription factor [Streptomyces sp. NBC_00102]